MFACADHEDSQSPGEIGTQTDQKYVANAAGDAELAALRQGAQQQSRTKGDHPGSGLGAASFCGKVDKIRPANEEHQQQQEQERHQQATVGTLALLRTKLNSVDRQGIPNVVRKTQ